MEISNEQIQKIHDMIDGAKLNHETAAKGRPLYELNQAEYGIANYWNGKAIALSDVLHLLGL